RPASGFRKRFLTSGFSGFGEAAGTTSKRGAAIHSDPLHLWRSRRARINQLASGRAKEDSVSEVFTDRPICPALHSQATGFEGEVDGRTSPPPTPQKWPMLFPFIAANRSERDPGYNT